MATELAPVELREVLRCDHCFLVQFRTVSDRCRRCRRSLNGISFASPEPLALVDVDPEDRDGRKLATVVRDLRRTSNFSQQKLAARMGVPRSYISKIERGEVTITAVFLERLATALEADMSELLCRIRPRADIIALIAADPFLVELATYAPKLDTLQRSIFLNHVREIANGHRRTPSFP